MENMDYRMFWDEAISQFSKELDEQTYTIWFKKLEYNSATENSITLSVPTQFYRDWIFNNYKNMIEKKLIDITGMNLALKLIVLAKPEAPVQEKPVEKVEEKPTVVSVSQKSPEKSSIPQHTQLNPDFTFDKYIVGENNSYAASAGEAIASNPGVAYNPFLIYGGVGLGKTHLMHAIGNKAYQLNPKLKIICITAEDFLNNFTDSLSRHDMKTFKNKYRSADMLLIDDIQFIQDKEGIQNELFHTFNELKLNKRQIIFTSDRPASELKDFTERLKSRISSGINADLQPPDYETRCAILQKKVVTQNFDISDDVIKLVAKNISTNVRDLEAALLKLSSFSKLANVEITLDFAQKQLQSLFTPANYDNVSIDNIIKTVAEEYKISAIDLKGKKKSRNIVVPRQVAMYIVREITEYSTTEVGSEFGGKDHTTVMHACQKVEDTMKTDSAFSSRVHKLINKLGQH